MPNSDTPATAHIVVGYSATSTGQDALRLGVAIARERDAHLYLVMVAPQDDVFTAAQPFDHSYGRIRDRQLQTWLESTEQLIKFSHLRSVI